MNKPSIELKLFMVLLGSKAAKRNVEQHDYFFGIAADIKELVPQMKAFWPEAGQGIHMDGWREVNFVEGYSVRVVLKEDPGELSANKLFFINLDLGGYQSGKLQEQHYTVLTVQADRDAAIYEAKRTVFYKTNTVNGAGSHIDEKYGIDVDDIYRIEDILSPEQKAKYHLQISSTDTPEEDIIHLGYFKLDKMM